MPLSLSRIGSNIATLDEVPVIVRNFDDETALGVALVENLQRTDLNILEEADGYRLLMNKFGYTQEKLSAHLGKSRSHIANFLRLLSMPKAIQEKINRIFLNTWVIQSSIELTNDILDNGDSPAVISAIMKQQCTERARIVLNDAMDIHAGAAICIGYNNFLEKFEKNKLKN